MADLIKAVNKIRKGIASEFVPGQLVKVQSHVVNHTRFRSIGIHPTPGDADVTETISVNLDDCALIIGVVAINRDETRLNERWLLLLTDRGEMGWTVEIEGLRILSPGER